jgi:hypothetical protein
VLLAGCAADMPPDRDIPGPDGFVVGPRKEIVGPIRLTRPATLGREAKFSMYAQLPREGQFKQFGFVASTHSEIDLSPGSNIVGKMTQIISHIQGTDMPMDAESRAAFKEVVFTSSFEWDPQCKAPSFRNFGSSDKTATAKDMQAFEQILTVLDADMLTCFQSGVRVGSVGYVPAREIVGGELFGAGTDNVEGSVRIRVEGIGTFDGREAISVVLAGSPQLKADAATLSGRYDGHIVFDAQTGIILSLKIEMAMQGVGAGGREARYATTRTIRVREMR